MSQFLQSLCYTLIMIIMLQPIIIIMWLSFTIITFHFYYANPCYNQFVLLLWSILLYLFFINTSNLVLLTQNGGPRCGSLLGLYQGLHESLKVEEAFIIFPNRSSCSRLRWACAAAKRATWSPPSSGIFGARPSPAKSTTRPWRGWLRSWTWSDDRFAHPIMLC